MRWFMQLLIWSWVAAVIAWFIVAPARPAPAPVPVLHWHFSNCDRIWQRCGVG